MYHFGVLQLVFRRGTTRSQARLCASWRRRRRLFSEAFWEESTTELRVFHSGSCSIQAEKPIVSDTGAVDATVMRQSCCADRKLRARRRACAQRRAVDKTSGFFDEQKAWLSAFSLDAVQGSGKVLGHTNLLVRRFVSEFGYRWSWLLPHMIAKQRIVQWRNRY